ncbi:MAG: acyl-CoA dehydrogenase family protein, partial [Vicinamibacterales bacterium]
AQTVAGDAAAIDDAARIPDDTLAAAMRLVAWDRDPSATVLALEELAAASGAVAAAAVLGAAPGEPALSGLRGVAQVSAPSGEQELGLAAVSLGLGRAALDEALGVVRARGDRASGEPADPPHWVLADAATELAAARLLVHATVQDRGLGSAAALVFAAQAAVRAVDAAVRVIGPDALRPGSALERCSRDVRAAGVVLGTEDQARLRAADRLLG